LPLLTLTLGRFAGQDVAVEGPFMLQPAAARGFEPFGRSPMGFDFGHLLTSLANLAAGRAHAGGDGCLAKK
jgi:hypothetical protein